MDSTRVTVKIGDDEGCSIGASVVRIGNQVTCRISRWDKKGSY